jgi:uncharacterized protein YecT (DUF1311 family)
MSAYKILALILALTPTLADAQTQMDLNQAEGAKYAAADKAMNAAYLRLTAKISGNGRKALREAQRSWIAFRDLECAFDTLGTKDGSIHPMEAALCLTRLTSQRTADLNAQINCEEGDVSCGGQ